MLFRHASLHCWKNFSWMRHYGQLDYRHVFQNGTIDDPLELEEKKNMTRSKIRRIKKSFKYGDILLRHELPDAQSIVSRCFVVVKPTPQRLFADFLIDRLALYQNSLWTLTLTSKNGFPVTFQYDALNLLALGNLIFIHKFLQCYCF